jgi:hypothetical protein
MEGDDTQQPAINARVSIEWDAGSWYEGTVDSHRTVLSNRNLPRAEFHVLYDDGEKHWHHRNEWNIRAAKHHHQVDERRIMLRCCLSLQPLLDPGKSGACAHPTCCNFQQLRDHAARTNACPMQGCTARIARTRDVVRDDALRHAIEQLQAKHKSLPEHAWWSETTETLRPHSASQSQAAASSLSSLKGRAALPASASRATARANSAPAEVEAIALDESDDDESKPMAAERPSVVTESDVGPAESAGLPAEVDGHVLELSSNASSGYKGVYLSETSGQFVAVVTKSRDAEAKYIGVFPSILEAATARAKFLAQPREARPLLQLSTRSSKRGREEEVDVVHTNDEAMERPPVVTEAEGLRLHLSATSPSGYRGVSQSRGGTYTARYIRGNPSIQGNTSYLGTFDTAIDAAVAYARFALSANVQQQGQQEPSAVASRFQRPSALCKHCGQSFLTAAQAARHEIRYCKESIEAALNTIVSQLEKSHRQQDQQMSRSSERAQRGKSVVDVEPTLHVSPEGVADAPEPKPPVVTEAEGLRLHLSATSPSGYRGVSQSRGGTYTARYIRGNPSIQGNTSYLGTFGTAIDAAVAYACLAKAEGIEPPSDPSASTSAAGDASALCPLCEIATDDETVVSWLQCDECFVWCHAACAGVDDASCLQIADFYCPTCRGACSLTGVQRVMDSGAWGKDRGKQCCVQHESKIKDLQEQVTTLQHRIS